MELHLIARILEQIAEEMAHRDVLFQLLRDKGRLLANDDVEHPARRGQCRLAGQKQPQSKQQDQAHGKKKGAQVGRVKGIRVSPGCDAVKGGWVASNANISLIPCRGYLSRRDRRGLILAAGYAQAHKTDRINVI